MEDEFEIEVSQQRVFENVMAMHYKFKKHPEEFFTLYEKFKSDFKAKGYTEDTAHNASCLLLAFPILGKDELAEDEMVAGFKKVEFILEHGMFQW
jgi:hypothetical protein